MDRQISYFLFAFCLTNRQTDVSSTQQTVCD